jgi:hypothetical protein
MAVGQQITTQPVVIVRPGDEQRDRSKLSSASPDIMRINAILELMKGKATLSRISREQIILESLIDAAEELGYNLPATRVLVTSSRELSPGLDGLGRGEAVKCLVAHAQGSFYPASAFEQDKKPGILQRLMAFMSGARKPETQNG